MVKANKRDKDTNPINMQPLSVEDRNEDDLGRANDVNFDNDDDDDEEINDAAHDGVETAPNMVSDGRYHNKQRCLTLCSRGVTARYRHLLEDLRVLIPHHKKESKLDCNSHDGGVGTAVTNICDIRNCNTVMYMECRKRGQDAYLYMGYPAKGPSVKFHLSNIHTMDELKLTGNCMKYSRPVLSFDTNFTAQPHLLLIKNLLIDIFGTPRGHPKCKPFMDRVMAFYYGDNRIWVRNYQILEQHANNALEAQKMKKLTGGLDTTSTSLVEIGPRFVLNPIRIFRGGNFGGQTLYQNSNFISPNTVRANEKRDKGSTYTHRKASQQKRKDRLEQIVVPEDPLSNKRVFR